MLYSNGSATSGLNSFTAKDVIGVELCQTVVPARVKFYKNGRPVVGAEVALPAEYMLTPIVCLYAVDDTPIVVHMDLEGPFQYPLAHAEPYSVTSF